MKKTREKIEIVVQADVPTQKVEKIWFVQLGQVRRHSRVLYLPLDSNIVNLFRIKKGDRIKYMMLQLIRAPAEDEPIADFVEKEPTEVSEERNGLDEGEL